MSFRGQLLTPEPTLRAQAARINNWQRPSLSSSNTSPVRPPRATARPSFGGGKATPRPSVVSPTASQVGDTGPYKSNPFDQLDLEIGRIVNAQTLHLPIERVDLPLTRLAGLAQTPAEWTARYHFGSTTGKPTQCKLVERERGGVKQRKVMCKIAGGWQELESLLLNMQAAM